MGDSINHIVKKLRENRILSERKDYNKYSREQLIELAQEGDQLAFEFLLKSHRDLIKMFSRKYFLKTGDQDDLEQIAAVGLWQAIMDWNGSGNFDSFAGMYIKRAIAKELDKESAEKIKIHNDADSIDATIDSDSGEGERTLGDTLPSGGLSLEDEIIGKEGMKDLSEFLKSNFNQKEREVIEKYIEGYKVREISEVLDMPYKTAENILYKIKYKLKEYMKNRDVRESTKMPEDIKFSDEEKIVLRRALQKIKMRESLDESSIRDKYEDYTEEQLDDELSEIEDALYTYDRLGLHEYQLDDLQELQDNLIAMEDFLNDKQYELCDKLFRMTLRLEKDCIPSDTDPHAEEKIYY